MTAATVIRDLSDDAFAAMFGDRRGDLTQQAADGDWAAVLSGLRAAGPHADDVRLLAGALAVDLHAGYRHSATRALQRFGVSSIKARRVVIYKGRTMHLLAAPLGEQDGRYPTTMCAKTLAGLANELTAPMRGRWANPEDRPLTGPDTTRRCKDCARHADKVAEASEPTDFAPFFPDAQPAFAADVAAHCQALASDLLDRTLTVPAAAAHANAMYVDALLDHAVALAHTRPTRCLHASYPGNDVRFLREELAWPGDVSELLDEVNWRAVFTPALPRDRRDLSGSTVTGWQEHRDRLKAHLEPIAARRARARRIELAQAKVTGLKSQLAAAGVELDAAQAE